jgi:hypothetical protein
LTSTISTTRIPSAVTRWTLSEQKVRGSNPFGHAHHTTSPRRMFELVGDLSHGQAAGAERGGCRLPEGLGRAPESCPAGSQVMVATAPALVSRSTMVNEWADP